MRTLLDCVIETIFNNPDDKKWTLTISKQLNPIHAPICDARSSLNKLITIYWCHNLGPNPIQVEDKGMSIDLISSLFVNSGLLINLISGINSRTNRSILTIKIKEIDLNNRYISQQWREAWSKLLETRASNIKSLLEIECIKWETEKLTKLIIKQLSLFPYNQSWQIKIPRTQISYKESLHNIINRISQEKLLAYCEKSQIQPWLTNQNSRIILNIKRQSNAHVFRKYISRNTESLEQRFPDLCCPISHNLMTDPVILGDTGHTYDRESISLALSYKPNIDPVSNQRILNTNLTPNYTLINIIKKIITENEPELILI